MEAIYGIIISILLGLSLLIFGILIRTILAQSKKNVERTEANREDIIRLLEVVKVNTREIDKNVKSNYKTRSDFTALYKLLNEEVRAIDKRTTVLER